MPGLAERARRAAQRAVDLARPRRRRDWEKKLPHEPVREVFARKLKAVEEDVKATIRVASNQQQNLILPGPGAYIDVWPRWNYSSTGTLSGSTSTVTVNNLTWTEWNTNTITVTGSATGLGQYGATWQYWVDTEGRMNRGPVPIRQETEAECRLRQEQTRRWQEEQRARYEKEDRERRLSKARARKLLVDCLNPQQRDDYEKRGFFHLYTNKGRKYRIHQGTHGNVRLIDVTTDEELGSYCSQPSGVPDEDAMLAQKLYLEIDEDEFIARANFRPSAQRARGLLDHRGLPIELRAAA